MVTAMEIEGTDGSKTHINPNSTTLFGRHNGFYPSDSTVSRRHISFDFNPSLNQTPPRVSFEVVGKNPVWIFTKHEGEKVRVFKRFQRGELGIGDMFCINTEDPVWFTVKKLGEEVENETVKGEIEIGGKINDELSQSLEIASGFEGNGDFDLGSIDVSDFDPVQEFGFLVIGHEFDKYQKQMISDMKKWNWFLEDPIGDSDDEEVAKKRGGRRKRKKTRDYDVDEEWTGESENEEAVTTKARKVQRPKYHTRSKDPGKKYGKSTMKTSSKEEKEEEEYEDEEDEKDETLGGFIVCDDTVEDDDDDVDEDESDEEEEFVEDELEE